MSDPNSAPTDDVSRRALLYGAGAVSAATLLGATREVWAQGRKRRFAIVGLGSRSNFFRQAIETTYAASAEIVGYCDTNIGRLGLARNISRQRSGKRIPIYRETAFERMLADTRADAVIVTTPDASHDGYIIRALELGCDVITEKPMTTTAEKCTAILEAQASTGKSVRVGFNYRYSPPRTQVKDLLMSGAIGDVLSVDFHWLLNTHHGADYFRRWHSRKDISGGLMVHKATHHFDLVNWWLSAIPVSVYANGKRDYYTPTMARRIGLQGAHERCRTCPEKQLCGFELDLAANPNLKALYLDHERHDGYFRDQCVFREEIDIEDTMNVVVKYDNDATLSYSLNAFNAWEGYTIAFNGTKGRIEHSIVEQSYISGDGTTQGGIADGGVRTRLIPLRGPPQDLDPWEAAGGHGGGDPVLLDDLFLPEPPEDKYKRAADQRAGAFSILTGVAANESMRTGNPIVIADLVAGMNAPDYPPMPGRDAALPMPDKMRIAP